MVKQWVVFPFFPLFVALVSHCNVQLPLHFMVDFGYVADQILRSHGATPQPPIKKIDCHLEVFY